MLYQLLSNAWRAAGQEGSVTIQLSLLGRRAVLHVTNTGKGISEAALGAAFDPERAEVLFTAHYGLHPWKTARFSVREMEPWLAKCRVRDREMVVVRKELTIR